MERVEYGTDGYPYKLSMSTGIKNTEQCPTAMSDFEIKVSPFDWNDNMSELAQEDFSAIQKKLPYYQAQSIGMALAKLELLEKQGCKVEETE